MTFNGGDLVRHRDPGPNASLGDALRERELGEMQPQVATRAELGKRGALRSRQLVDAITSLDTQPSGEAVAQIMEWIRAEYEARGGGTLLGLFSRCYLGPPYVDHIMTTTGAICEHFEGSDAVPEPYARARPLATSTAYAYIEIYADGAIVPIRSDGSPVT